MTGNAGQDRWFLTGPLGIGTEFAEPTDAQSALSVSWAGVGTAVRHGSADALNLLDGRPGAMNQGANLSWWGLNGAGKAVRLGLITSRFAATADGGAASYLSLYTKAPNADVAEALRITERGDIGIGTTAPENAENWSKVVDVVGAGHAKLSLRTGSVEGRVLAHDQGWWGGPSGMVVGTRTGHALSLATSATTRLRISASGDVDLVGQPLTTLTVGAGANGQIRVRHINGKSHLNDNPDVLALNYNTAMPVQIGGGGRLSNLNVSGDIVLDGGRQIYAPGRLHISGDEVLYLLNRNGVVVGQAWGGNGNLLVEGEARINNRLVVGAARTWIAGFDTGVQNGYHWIKTIDDENHMWMGFAMVGGVPNRIEFGTPIYGTLYGTVRNPSDARLKEDIRELDDVLGRLETLRGVSYVRHPQRAAGRTGDAPLATSRREIGVLAQEVETVFPELVSSDGTGMRAVDYAGLTGVLVEAVKGLHEENRALRRRLTALEGHTPGGD
jgi:hypothetical protein